MNPTPPAAASRVLEGRPFLPGRKRIAVLTPYFPHPPSRQDAAELFSRLREIASEFDVVLFTFGGGAEEEHEPALEFCSRLVLVAPPSDPPRTASLPPEASAHRSQHLQELWDTLPSEFGVDARHVISIEMASYGGDVLLAPRLNSILCREVFEREKTVAAWRNWRRWRRYEREHMKRFRHVIAESALERAMLREITDPPPLIRVARKTDVPELDRIQHAAPEAVLWDAEGYLSYDCRVAEVGAKVAGFVVCRELSGDEDEVLSLVVDPPQRRRGVAQKLMREVLDRRSRSTWYLEVRESNWRARKLYTKLGFEDVSLRPGYYQDTGEAAVVMRLKPC